MAVGVGDECPGDPEDTRVAGERSARELRQFPVEPRGQVGADLADLGLDDVVVVEQPFRRRGDRLPTADGGGDRAVGGEQYRLIVLEPLDQRGPRLRPSGDDLGDGEARRVILESFDAEELVANELIAVPGRHACHGAAPSPPGAPRRRLVPLGRQAIAPA